MHDALLPRGDRLAGITQHIALRPDVIVDEGAQTPDVAHRSPIRGAWPIPTLVIEQITVIRSVFHASVVWPCYPGWTALPRYGSVAAWRK
jgi:hypothetical protein